MPRPGPALPMATLRFLEDWREEQDGLLVQGGTLRIEYAVERTVQAFASPGGLPPSNLEVHLRFEPGRQHLAGSVSAAVDLPIPENAREVVVWFQATDRDRTVAWDSRYGENYRYPVFPSGAAGD